MTEAVRLAEGTGIVFRRYSWEHARELRSVIEEIYTGSYTEAIASGHSFDSVEAFMSRYDIYSSRADFDLVIGYDGDQPVGQTWGWPLDADSQWWTGLDNELDPDDTREDGQRTFGLSEIMVVVEWAGKGIAHALHDTLLIPREEERASLLVEPDNSRARRAYEHWGWRKVAQLTPSWNDAPTFDVLILNLPV